MNKGKTASRAARRIVDPLVFSAPGPVLPSCLPTDLNHEAEGHEKCRGDAGYEEPAYDDQLREMRAVLDAWIMESNDQGRIPEPPEILEYWERRMSENYDARIEDMLEERRRRRRR